jgi:hypothetical protein
MRFLSSPVLPDRLWGSSVSSSPLFNAKVKNEWSCNSTFTVCLHGEDRDNFTGADFGE